MHGLKMSHPHRTIPRETIWKKVNDVLCTFFYLRVILLFVRLRETQPSKSSSTIQLLKSGWMRSSTNDKVRTNSHYRIKRELSYLRFVFLQFFSAAWCRNTRYSINTHAIDGSTCWLYTQGADAIRITYYPGREVRDVSEWWTRLPSHQSESTCNILLTAREPHLPTFSLTLRVRR